MRKKMILAILFSAAFIFLSASSLKAQAGKRVRFSIGMEAGASFSSGYMRRQYDKSFWGLNTSAEFGSTERTWNIRAGLGIHHIVGTAIEWATLNRVFPEVTPENISPGLAEYWMDSSRVDSFCFRLGAAWYPIKGNRAFYVGGGGTLAESEEAYAYGATFYYSDGTNDSGYANGVWSGGIGAHLFTGYKLGRFIFEVMVEYVPHGWGKPAVSLGLLTLSLSYQI